MPDLDRLLPLCAGASQLPDAVGQTALFYAVQRSSDSEAAQLAAALITEAKLEPTRKDFGGQSPLFYAAAVGNLETVKLLIAHGCDPDEKDSLNQSPLFYASRDGRELVVKFLVEERGVDPNQCDRNGQTPLFYAARENKRRVAEILLNAGASAHHRDLTGRQPVYFAKLNSHEELADFLGSLSEEGGVRKRCRLVFVGPDGVAHAPTAQQLEWLEEQFPDICVWKRKTHAGAVAGLKPQITASPPIAKPIWMTAARQIMSDLFKKEDAWIFLRPVDPVRDMCPDYLSVIAEPMDFGTIRKKIAKYACKAEFLADLELVFSNCRSYNKPGTLPDILCQRVVAFLANLLEEYSFAAIPDTKAVAVE